MAAAGELDDPIYSEASRWKAATETNRHVAYVWVKVCPTTASSSPGRLRAFDFPGILPEDLAADLGAVSLHQQPLRLKPVRT